MKLCSDERRFEKSENHGILCSDKLEEWLDNKKHWNTVNYIISLKMSEVK